MTTERQAAKADAANVDLDQAERVADQWLALALRKLARDPNVLLSAVRRLASNRIIDPNMTPEQAVAGALRGIADHLEGA